MYFSFFIFLTVCLFAKGLSFYEGIFFLLWILCLVLDKKLILSYIPLLFAHTWVKNLGFQPLGTIMRFVLEKNHSSCQRGPFSKILKFKEKTSTVIS